MSVIDQRLKKIGIELPAAKIPVANYLGTKRSGDLLFVSVALGASPALVMGARAATKSTTTLLG